MVNKVIDVSNLNPKQIAIIEEIIATFKTVSQQNQSSQYSVKIETKKQEELEQLHQEFDWLVADLGVKEPISRSNIYGVK